MRPPLSVTQHALLGQLPRHHQAALICDRHPGIASLTWTEIARYNAHGSDGPILRL